MAKVYALAGILTVLSVAGLFWLLVSLAVRKALRAEKKKEKDEEPYDGAVYHRRSDGRPGYWV